MSEVSGWQERTLYQQLLRTVERFPENEFMVYGDMRPTYRVFLENVDRLTKSLLALGVKRGDNVAIWMGNCPEWIYVWQACASIGACLVPVNTRYRTHEVEYILKQSDSIALIMKDRFLNIEYLPILSEIVPELAKGTPGALKAEKLPDLRNVIVLSEQGYPGTLSYEQFLKLGKEVTEGDHRQAQAQVSPDDRVIMVYTSGTTGFPKGAMHNHHILRNMTRTVEWLRYTERERIFIGALPFFHVFGSFAGATCALISGACVVTMDAYEAGDWLALWAKERCTSIYGVPTMFIMALDHPDLEKFDLSSARTGLMGGALCPVEVVRAIHTKMGAKVLTAYGMTETTAVTTLSDPDDDPEIIANTVGQAIGGWEIKIADPETGAALAPNEQGEIWTRGHHVMMGYYKKPEETAKAIDEDGWFRSGDLATCDERGYYRITGRLKDMFIVGGFNAYPAEIEDFLFQHPKIKQVYVVGVPDYKMGEVGMAFIELKEGQMATAEEVLEFCKGKLGNFKVPRYVKFVQEWPMTATGKIQKFKLRDQAVDELGLQQVAQARLLESDKKKG